MPIVLASTSPRRQELLKNAGLEFVVKPANIPEVRHEGEPPQAFAERMAKEKAGAIWAHWEAVSPGAVEFPTARAPLSFSLV